MSLLFLTEEPTTLDHGTANGMIREGEPVVREDSSNLIHQYDPANDSRVDAIVVHQRDGVRLPRHDEEFIEYENFYNIEDGETPVPIQPIADLSTLKQWTVWDTSLPEPTYEKNAVVGYALLGDGFVSCVPEGYSDGDTTYGRESAGAFTAVGRVDHDPAEYENDAYETRVEIRIEDDLFY